MQCKAVAFLKCLQLALPAEADSCSMLYTGGPCHTEELIWRAIAVPRRHLAQV